MKKTQSLRKLLPLSSETLRQLAYDDLQHAAGGNVPPTTTTSVTTLTTMSTRPPPRPAKE